MRGLGLFLLVAWCVWPGIAIAQEGAKTPIFQDEVAVELVQIELRVNDKKGRPILDLAREDVEVFVDGQKVDVAHFERLAPAPSSREDSPATAESGPPDDRTFWLAVMIDETGFEGPAARKRAYAGVLGLLDSTLPAKTRLLFLVNGSSPRIVQSFTADLAAVRRAVAAEAAFPPAAPPEFLPSSRVFREISDAWWRMEEGPLTSGCADGMNHMLQIAQERAIAVSARVDQSLATMGWLTQHLAGLPGKKALLFTGLGLEPRPGLEAFRMIADLCPDEEAEWVSSHYSRFDRTDDLRQVTRQANAGGITVYSADASGLNADDQISLSGVVKLRPSSFTMRLEALNRHAGLHQVARDTGGKAVLNANDLAAAFDDVAADLSHHYAVGFYYPSHGDGELHDIGVRIAGRPYDVRYRTQFRDVPKTERIERSLLASLLFGAHQNPLNAELHLTPAETATRATLRLPVGGLTLLPTERGAHGLVRLVFAVRDDHGEWRTPRQKQLEIDLAPATDEARAETREVIVDFDLAPGTYTVAVAVRDEIGGVTSALEQPYTVAVK